MEMETGNGDGKSKWKWNNRRTGNSETEKSETGNWEQLAGELLVAGLTAGRLACAHSTRGGVGIGYRILARAWKIIKFGVDD